MARTTKGDDSKSKAVFGYKIGSDPAVGGSMVCAHDIGAGWMVTMRGGSLDDMRAFAAVARASSFTRAAAELGVSPSALSNTIKRLETRLDIRLLQRNSRSVALTTAGEQLLRKLGPALAEIDGAIDQLGRQRASVAGTVRITAPRQAFSDVLRPVLAEFGAANPDAVVEVMIDHEFRDIIVGRFDAGIRLGEHVEQDMIAMRLGPDARRAVVASPDYLGRHGTPHSPERLIAHRCIGYRVKTAGALLPWSFQQGDRQLQIKVEPFLVVNEVEIAVDMALDGLGIAYALEHGVAPYLSDGRLVRLLEDWTPPFPGFFLYYPSRRQIPAVLAALIDLLRKHRS